MINEFGLKQVSVRLVKDATLYSDIPINSPEAAVHMLKNVMREFDRELICVINLRTDGKPINCHFVSIGSINQSLAHPREILKTAILSNAASMIMIHNHLGSNVTPSKHDKDITQRMLEVCSMVGIPLLDHVIVAADSDMYYSFSTEELLQELKDNMYHSKYNFRDSFNKAIEERYYATETEVARDCS